MHLNDLFFCLGGLMVELNVVCMTLRQVWNLSETLLPPML